MSRSTSGADRPPVRNRMERRQTQCASAHYAEEQRSANEHMETWPPSPASRRLLIKAIDDAIYFPSIRLQNIFNVLNTSCYWGSRIFIYHSYILGVNLIGRRWCAICNLLNPKSASNAHPHTALSCTLYGNG